MTNVNVNTPAPKGRSFTAMQDKFTQFANPDSEHKLKVDSAAEVPLHRLPFVGSPEPGNGMSFWTVPAAGGYSGGCKTGQYLAKIYLKHVLDHGTMGGTLQLIALDMFGVGISAEKENQPSLSSSRKGQVVGFFAEIDEWLKTAVSMHKFELNNMDVGATIRAAEGGLNFDEAAWHASMRRSEKARNKSTTAKKKKVGAK
jgi:hypothetical protein